MRARNSNVELVRIVASLMIVGLHLGLKIFSFAWIYVEVFLILTGYFTAKHFDGKNYDNPMKMGLVYTIKKLVLLLPYSFVATIMMYSINFVQMVSSGEMNIVAWLINTFKSFFLDFVLITPIDEHSIMGILWYVSAWLYIMPVFARIAQIKNRFVIIVMELIVVLMYYEHYNGIPLITRGIPALARVWAGMGIGVLIYELLFLVHYNYSKFGEILLTFVEILFYLVPIIYSFKDVFDSRFFLMCFSISLCITLSNFSLTRFIRNRLINYLGRLSCPIYFFHIAFIQICDNFLLLTGYKRILFSYASTVAFSMVIMMIVSHFSFFSNAEK